MTKNRTEQWIAAERKKLDPQWCIAIQISTSTTRLLQTLRSHNRSNFAECPSDDTTAALLRLVDCLEGIEEEASAIVRQRYAYRARGDQ